MLADPTDPAGLYGANNDALWHSADRGATWQVVAQGLSDRVQPRLHFLVHPQSPGWLLAWDERSLWRSQDGGKTWDKRALPVRVSEGQHQIILHPWDSQRFFLVVADFNNQKVYSTRDDGESWEQLELPATRPPAGTLSFDPAGQLYVGAGRSNGRNTPVPRLYISSEGGKDWQMVEGEVKGSYGWYFAGLWTTEALFVEPSDPRILLAYINNSLMRSTDGGLSWRDIGLQGSVGFAPDYAEIMGYPREPGIYYLADIRGIFRSVDFGQSWERRTEGLPPRAFFSMSYHLAMDPLRPGTLYAAVGNSRLWRSRDAGLNWEHIATLMPDQYIYALVIHPLEPQKLYLVTAEGLYRTEDEGLNWNSLLDRGDRVFAIPRLRLDPFDLTHLLLVTGPELLETRDGGQTWKSLSEGLTARPWFYDAAVDPGDGEMVYAATPWGVYRLNRTAQITAVEEEEEVRPQRFSLSPNYPNPFNPSTTIRFTLPQRGEAELSIYSLLGQRVATLVQGVQEAGPHLLQWDGRDDGGRELASGVYCCRLQAGTQVETRKLLLLR
ncbi:MAG: T9SS type A sorting domain-containing protein [Chloroflexi bacterium]|nr:T9SS type A sorting domain-containing protein [Chloroflexota bacterium]